MIAFWMVAAGLSAAAGALVLAVARRAERRAVADPTVAVHKRQLAEIDDLVGRGLLSEDERAGARAEAGRRLLAAADDQPAAVSSGGRRIVPVVAAVAPLLAIGMYLAVGSPGVADAPMAGRVAEWRKADPATLSAPQIAALLGLLARERPNDPELLKNLALARRGAGDLFGASRALRQAVAARPDDPELWTALGQSFVDLANGQVGSDAKQAFGEALKRDPKAMIPRYHLSLARIAEGQVAEGLAGWRSMAADMSPADPRRAGLLNDIAQVEKAGGLPQAPAQPPPAAEGQDMSEAIQGMVAGLAARLEAEPNDPQGWARLVRAYTVLGETAKRDAALAKAREIFKDRPDVLAQLAKASEGPQ